jgi:hypothetical protein
MFPFPCHLVDSERAKYHDWLIMPAMYTISGKLLPCVPRCHCLRRKESSFANLLHCWCLRRKSEWTRALQWGLAIKEMSVFLQTNILRWLKWEKIQLGCTFSPCLSLLELFISLDFPKVIFFKCYWYTLWKK